jgi:hypothetical protein
LSISAASDRAASNAARFSQVGSVHGRAQEQLSNPFGVRRSPRVGRPTFGPPAPVSELNDASANDIQPNVRKDGGRLLVEWAGTLGGQDVWVATRESVFDPWSAPLNLGAAVNTGANETRPSLSWDALTLLFGRAPGPEGMSDIYIATRESS